MSDTEEEDNNVMLDYIYNAYSYLEDLLIIKEHEINHSDDWITKSKHFLLRYRRIIGIVMLCIVIYIALYCEPVDMAVSRYSREEYIQKGGASDAVSEPNPLTSLEVETPKPKPILSAEEKAKRQAEGRAKSRKQQGLQSMREQNEIKAEYAKEQTDKAKQKEESDKQQKADEKKAYKNLSRYDKARLSATQTTDELKGKIKETKYGKKMFDSFEQMGKDAKGKTLRGKAGVYVKGIGKSTLKGVQSGIKNAPGAVYKMGSYVGETAKEYSQIFYQLLFAVVITVCILMIFLPSLTFFFIGLVCYFLLKKKMANLKMF